MKVTLKKTNKLALDDVKTYGRFTKMSTKKEKNIKSLDSN